MYRGAELAAAPRTGGTPLRPCPTSGTSFDATAGRRVIGQRRGVPGTEHHQTHAAKLPGPGSDSLLAAGRQILLPTSGYGRLALPQNRSDAITMPLDYLNEASDEVQRLFTRLDDVECTLRKASEERRPMIGEELYLTGEEVCTRLHLSPRTLQTLRDRRQIPFTVLGNRLLLYPESGIRTVLDRNLRPAADEFPL